MLALIPVDDALENEPGCLIELPVIEDTGSDTLCLTADDWLALRVRRAAAGRPLTWLDVPAGGFASRGR